MKVIKLQDGTNKLETGIEETKKKIQSTRTLNRNFKLFSLETGIILMHVFNQFF